MDREYPISESAYYSLKERLVNRINGITIEYLCIAFGWLVLSSFLFLFIFDEDAFKRWMEFGPQDDFLLLGTFLINTWLRYFALFLVIIILRTAVVVLDEIAWPAVKFSVYDPKVTEIFQYTKDELTKITKTIIFQKKTIKFLLTMIMISRFDVGLMLVFVDLFITNFTVDFLINKKVYLLPVTNPCHNSSTIS